MNAQLPLRFAAGHELLLLLLLDSSRGTQRCLSVDVSAKDSRAAMLGARAIQGREQGLPG